jgi:stage V sporulation protein K
MMFMGNPGTGKTTVARLVGEIFALEKIIPCGRFFEVSPTTLKGEVSWEETFEQARGSVLFIDEAYTLGDNAVDQLIPYLENYREDTVVIFAGYKEEMKRFLGRNCGLVSRIPHHIDFPNYTHAELAEIADSVLSEKNYTISADAKRMLHRELRRFRFLEGNARDIRTIVEKAILEAAVRLHAELNTLPPEKLHTLEASDFAPVLRRIGKEHRHRVAASVYGSPLFIIPAAHAVRAAGHVAGGRLSGKRMTKKAGLALALESGISIGTELITRAIYKGQGNREKQ